MTWGLDGLRSKSINCSPSPCPLSRSGWCLQELLRNCSVFHLPSLCVPRQAQPQRPLQQICALQKWACESLRRLNGHRPQPQKHQLKDKAACSLYFCLMPRGRFIFPLCKFLSFSLLITCSIHRLLVSTEAELPRGQAILSKTCIWDAEAPSSVEITCVWIIARR